MSSSEEGLGTSLLDAMICEVPIVSTRAGGIPEIVIHEKTGLTCEVGDSASLAKYVESIYQREDLISNAKKMVIDSFTKEATAKKTYTHYKSILS